MINSASSQGWLRQNKAWSNSLWMWWIITTGIYLLFNLLGYPNSAGETPTLLGHVAGFVGLFVPFGFLSAFLLISPFYWFSLAVFLISMIYADRWLKSRSMNTVQRILINLLVLMAITFIVDIVRFTPFESWRIFLQGSFPDYINF